MSYRRLKSEVLSLLLESDLPAALKAIRAMPARQVVNPLFGLLYHGAPQVRWHAVTAMGRVVADLADQEMEAARVIMRRLMWNLNDESGGIGWGSPEAMGEILACHGRLAGEFATILVSYLNPCGNFLEHQSLQQGVLWGIGRLAHVRPGLAAAAAPFLPSFCMAPLAALRGHAVWAAGPILTPELRQYIEPLCSDGEPLTIYRDGRLVRCTVGRLANKALG